MDIDIRKSNKIPGCEQLTRPEEIAALSKYLGEIKKVQEEHTKLEKDSLGVPGMSFGRENPNDQIQLEDRKINIDGVSQSVELENTTNKLNDDRDLELSERKEILNTEIDNSLENHTESLSGRQDDIKLEEKTEHIQDTRENTLSTTVENLNSPEEINLETNIEGLNKNDIDVSLGNHKETLNADLDNTLGTKKEQLNVTKDSSLNNYVEQLENSKENNLSSFIDELGTEKDQPNLGDFIISLNNETSVEELVDSVISPNQTPEENIELENHKEEIEPEDEINNLETHKENITSSEVDSLSDISYSDYLRSIIQEANSKRDEEGLYRTAIKLFSQDNSEWAQRISSLMSAYLSSSKISPERAEEFENILAQSFIYPNSQIPTQGLRPENLNEDKIEEESDFQRSKKRVERGGDDIDTELETTTKQRPENIESRGTDDSYLDPDLARENAYIIKPSLYRLEDNNDGEGPGEKLGKNNSPSYGLSEPGEIKQGKFQYNDGLVRVPTYDQNINNFVDLGLAALNKGGVSNYLRKTAEEAVGSGDWTRGSLRTQLINEALALLVLGRDKLERLTKINRDRLPGDEGNEIYKTLSEGVGNSFGRLGYTGYDPKSGIQGIIRTGITIGEGMLQKGLGIGIPNEPFNRPEKDEKYGKVSVKFDTKYGSSYTSEPNMFKVPIGTGMGTTLSDLCGLDFNQTSQIGSIEELNDILSKSSLITTSNKINKGITRTLDSNMYWEVIMTPWVHNRDKYSNGGYSYLPSIREINTINLVENCVGTSYNKWIPISNFELQKSKLTTKSLGLFDGEINYPVTSEYTNELRLSIVDDQWKSWKHYFQKCSDVSVYNSEPHTIDFYEEQNPIPTAVDKTTVCTAFYKNIAFSIKIYIMTPQLSTIRKFHILAVLKDFSEDYAGETESGGSDLNVSFSIVGEVDDNDIDIEKSEAKKELDTMLSVTKPTNTRLNDKIGLVFDPKSPLIGQ
jgi:hypothetical protein